MNATLLEVVGWVGSAVLVVSLLQTNLHRLRWINLVGCLVLIGYNGLVGVWPMVGLNVVLAAINVWYLVRGHRDRHDGRAATDSASGPSTSNVTATPCGIRANAS